MDVEALAVNTISSIIARCPNLKAFIATNDKTPLTDGHIDLVGGQRQRNEDWIGRVSVQVKGRTRHTKRALSKHPISRTDLLAYQKSSGVLYFVVAVDAKSGDCTPYYKLLAPFTIKAILDQTPEDRREISVSLTALPRDPDAVERLLRVALKTRDQNLAQGFDAVLLEHFESFTVHTASELKLDAPTVLAPDTTDFALILNTTGGMSIAVPGELHIFPQGYTERRVDLRVRSGEIAYESAVVRRLSEESFEAVFSEGLRFCFHAGRSTNVSLTLENTLAGRLKALELFVALLDTETVEFNGNPSPLEVTHHDENAWLREHLKQLRLLAELFDQLDVDTHLIDVNEIDETQLKQLNVLHRAIVKKQEITNASADPARVLQEVGPWRLMFLMMPGSELGKWQLIDPFSVEVRRQFLWRAEGEEEAIPVTPYDALDEGLLGTVLNARLGSIVGAYEAITDFPSTYGLATQCVLALITAADTSQLRRGELLDAAARLNDWLVAEQGDEPRHLINGWQISSRQGALTPEVRRQIRGLKRQIARSTVNDADLIELACALLLQDEEEIEDLVGQMSEARLRPMLEWPIWKLRDIQEPETRPTRPPRP